MSSGAGPSSHPPRRPFDAASTRGTLDLACEDVRLDSTGAELLRLGENAIYRLPQEAVVARIARYADASQKEVDVARWLLTDESTPESSALRSGRRGS